jgi:hypothetical protein
MNRLIRLATKGWLFTIEQAYGTNAGKVRIKFFRVVPSTGPWGDGWAGQTKQVEVDPDIGAVRIIREIRRLMREAEAEG